MELELVCVINTWFWWTVIPSVWQSLIIRPNSYPAGTLFTQHCGGVLTSIIVTINSQSTWREVDFTDFILGISSINLKSIEVNEKLTPASAGPGFLPRSQMNRGIGILKGFLQTVYLPVKLCFSFNSDFILQRSRSSKKLSGFQSEWSYWKTWPFIQKPLPAVAVDCHCEYWPRSRVLDSTEQHRVLCSLQSRREYIYIPIAQ